MFCTTFFMFYCNLTATDNFIILVLQNKAIVKIFLNIRENDMSPIFKIEKFGPVPNFQE